MPTAPHPMPATQRPTPNAQCPPRLRRVAIDLVPIRVGEGGAGSGIWTYARELIHHMDQEEFLGLEIVCLVNRGQLPYLAGLQRVRLITFPGCGKNIVLRLFWIHLVLPLVCLFRRVDVLHKLATETPLFCPAKRVTTVHDFYYEFLMENHPPESIRLYERLENFYFSLTTRTCFKKSNAIIAVSDATCQEAVKRYPKAVDRIHVIHHGAPRSGHEALGFRHQGSPRNETQIPSTQPPTSSPQRRSPNAQRLKPNTSPFTILCVAKFMEHKGQHLLIDAFEALLEQVPDLIGRVRLELRGFHNDADYCRMIEQRMLTSRFSDAMEMIGFDPSDRLEEIYKAADLVVLLSSYEGFGLPVLEAQGMGIPVLCSNLPVLQEVGGDGAIYVDRDDLSTVADAMQRFVNDPDYHETMRTRALGNTKRFSWSNAAQETLDVYRGTIGRVGSREVRVLWSKGVNE